MAQAYEFPAFLSVDFGNNSGFRDFRISAAEAGDAVKRRFEKDMADVQGIVRKALTLPAGASGTLDLDTSGMRQAATQADITARATREVTRALEEAARASDDHTAATRRRIQAAQAAANEAEQEARAITAKATAYERVQAELNRTGIQMTAYAGTSRRVADSQRAVQQASIQAGQQLQDVAISLYSGQRAGVVFAQQLPQLSYALSGLAGQSNKTLDRIGKFATFLSGPWGLAVGLGVGVLATMVSKLWETGDAMKAAEMASNGLGSAQSALGQMFDLTTGKLKAQNEMLRMNIQLTAMNLRAEAMEAKVKAEAGLTDAGQYSWMYWFQGGEDGQPGAARTVRNTVARHKLEGVMSGTLDGSDVLKWAEKADFSRLDIDRAEYVAAVRAAFEARAKEGMADKIDLTMKSGKLADEFRTPDTKKPKKPKSDSDKELREARAIEDAVTSAADAVANLRGQFDAAPKDIDKTAKASLELESILTDIDRRAKDGKLTKAQKEKDAETRALIEDAQKKLLPEFLQRPITDRIKGADKELQIQRLLLQGREEEADLLRDQHDLMRQLGVDTKEQLDDELKKRGITKDQLDLLRSQREQIEINNRAQARLDRAVRSSGAKLRELDRAQESLTRAIADLPNDARGALKGLAASLRQQINDIIAARIADNIFGDLFAKLDAEIRGKKPIDAATKNYVDSTVKASTALIDLTSNILRASAAMGGVPNDNVLSAGKVAKEVVEKAADIAAKSLEEAYDPNGEIVVTAPTRKKNGAADEAAEALKTSARSLKAIAKSIMEGGFYGQAASSLVFGKQGSSLGSFVGGAIGKSLGEKFLGKGLESIMSGLGGAAGPIGAIAGGLLGSVVGGLFKKSPRGYATIGGSNGELGIVGQGGNSKSARKAGVQAADATLDTLDRIAEALGGSYDASRGSVSIGRSGDSWHVDTTGRGRLKKKQGGIDFDDDYEAAVRFATMDLIKDGVLTGLRASTQRLLQAGKELDAALQKALDFESVFTRLKEYRDPVGAAMDTLDKEFTRLKKIFDEASEVVPPSWTGLRQN